MTPPQEWPSLVTHGLLSLGPVPSLEAWSRDMRLLATADRSCASQSYWSDMQMRSVQTALLHILKGDDAVRFASQTRPHAMAWAAVTPAVALRTLIPHVDFQCLARWHVGAPILISPGTECPRCDARLDAFGHHLVCCMRNGIVQRHGVVQDAIHRLSLRAGLTARKEQAADDGSRPGDVFIPRLDANGPAALDVTVRHSLAPSRRVRSSNDVDG